VRPGLVAVLVVGLVAVLVGLAVLVVTPVGVWLAGGVAGLVAGTRGWDLEIGRHRGALTSGALLRSVHLRHEELGLEAEIDEISITLWSRKISLQGPRVRWTVPVDTTSFQTSGMQDSLRLLPADLPAMDITNGALWMRLPGDDATIEIEDISASLTPASEQALVELTLGVWSVTSAETTVSGTEANSRWALHLARVDLLEGFVRATSGTEEVTLRGTATLDLTSSLDLKSKFILEGDRQGFDGLWLDGTVAGSLAPMALRVTGESGAKHVDLGPLALSFAGRIDSATARVDSFDVQIAGGHVSGQMGFAIASHAWQVSADIDSLGLAPFTSGKLTGPVAGRLELSSTPDTLALTTELRAAVINGIAIDRVDLALQAQLQGDQLTARASSERMGTLEAAGRFEPRSGQYDLKLTGELDADPWIGWNWPLSLRGNLRADTMADTMNLEFRAMQLPFGDDPPGPILIDATLADWRYLDVRLAVDQDHVLAHAHMDLVTARLDTLTGSTRGLSASRLSQGLSGVLDGTIDAGGELGSQARGESLLRVDDLGIAGWNLGPTSLSTQFHRGTVSICAEAPGLKARVTVDTSGVARIDADMNQATAVRQNAGDTVRVTGRVRGHAPWQDVASGELHVEVDSARAEIAGWALHMPLGSRADYDNGHVHLAETRLQTPLGAMQLHGDATAGSVDFVADLHSLETSPHEQLVARGQAHLRVSGRLDDPQAHLALALRSLQLGGRSVGTLTAAIDLSDSLRGTLELASSTGDGRGLTLEMAAPAADFHPRGQPTGYERARIRIEARDLEVSTIATYVFDDSTGLTASMSADLQMPAHSLLDGMNWRDLSGYVELRQLTLDRDRVRLRLAAPSRAELDLGEATFDGLSLPVEIYRRDTDDFERAGRIQVDGRLTGDGGGLSVRIDSLELLAAARAIPGRVSLPAGILSLQANLTGTFERPSLDASANIELELLGYLSARVFGRPRAWNASALWVTPVEDSLQVAASAPAVNIWPKWDELTMRARSAGIDLLPLLDQVPELGTLTGTVRLDVTADSLVTDPHLVGQVEVEDLRFALLDVKPGYHFPTGRIQFAERDGGGAHAELHGFLGSTTQGSGQLALTGFFDALPKGGTDFQIQLTAQDVRYEYEDVFDVPDIDLELTLRSDGQGSLMEGNVRLKEAQVETHLVDLAAPPVPPPPGVPSDFLQNTRLDLYVDVDKLETRSELSHITLDGQARVYGTFYQPRFQGELEVTEGEVIILNRQFIFSHGRIVLDRLVPTYSIIDLLHEPILLDPDLDLEATATVQPNDTNEPEVEVTMSLVGPARTVAPRLTAPALGDGEVLNLLAFGQISPAGAGYANALYTAAGQLLLSRRVQRVGLDEFLLLPSGTTLGTVGESAVRIGKFLSWPVPIWVRYEASTTKAAHGEFEVEYHITNWMTIDASAYSEYQLYGLGVGLSREF